MEHLLKTKKELKNLKKKRDKKYIYRYELDKACFQHDMAYGDFKDLARRTASDKALRGKAFNIAKNPKYDGYHRGIASMVCKFFDKRSASLADKSSKYNGVTTLANKSATKNQIKQNQQLAEKSRKPII